MPVFKKRPAYAGLQYLCLIVLWLLGAMTGARADRVDDYVRAEMHRQHIPGLSLAVVSGGRTLKIEGYGQSNVELHVTADPRTVYHLASLTKQFTAASVLLLVRDGKIGLDDSISRYLKGTPDAWRDVTVRQLLTHTSGIKDEMNEMHGTTVKGTSAEEIAAELAKFPLNFTPGTRWSYSNSGYRMSRKAPQFIDGDIRLRVFPKTRYLCLPF